MMDRISELPCDLLSKILFLLPKEEVARASVVSKRCYSVSTSFPVLVFNQPAFERYNFEICGNFNMERDFCNSVDRLIQRRRESPVDTLEISIWNGEMAQERVGKWIAYAMERNVKHLVLHHYNRETWAQPGWHYNLPSSFWEYAELRTLELQGCNISGSGIIQNNFSGSGIIQNSLVENIREMCLVNIEVDNILLPNFSLLEKLELNNCWLYFGFSVSSVHLRTLKLIDCHNANYIVLDTLCLNRFHFKGHNELNVTWINASDKVEIELDLDHFPYISFSDVAKFLFQLSFCKILTIVCGESIWIEPDIFYLERPLTIEQLKMKIMRHYPQERSLMTVFADFLQISQRPVAVSAEVGEENTVDHVKLHFLYKHEVYECKGSWCSWRSCLKELKVFQSSMQQQQD